MMTRASDDGLIVWPEIKQEEKEELSNVELIEKDVTSEDGVVVSSQNWGLYVITEKC